MSDKAQDALIRLGRKRYYAYAYTVLNEGCRPDMPRYKRTKFHEWLCDEVQEFLEADTGNPYDILLLSVPPQHGKSLTITETLPSWYLGKNPEHRVICTAYGESLAKKFGKENKRKVNTFGKLYFDIEVSRTKKSMLDWDLGNERGGMKSVGITGGITGNPAHLMIIDDPIKTAAEASSASSREKIYNEWLSSLSTRIAVGGKVIVIQTRWHPEDLYGMLMDSENVRIINLSCICETDADPLGRSIGESLCPELGKDVAWAESTRNGLIRGDMDYEGARGAEVWESLFQGRPTIKGGNLVKTSWWQYYKREDIQDFNKTIISVDASFKEKSTSDYVVITVWGQIEGNFYLRHMVRKRLGFWDTLRHIANTKARFPETREILIEDKANGSAIIETLRKKISGIIAVEPKGGKEARAQAVTYVIESGNVFLPSGELWVRDFVREWAEFPRGSHDDIVDSSTQALFRLISRAASTNIAIKKLNKKKLSGGKGEKVNVI